MQRAAQNACTVGLHGAHRGFTTTLPSTVPHRTVTSSTQWACTPRVFLTSGFELLDLSIKLDEEILPTYQPEKYYPVNQGEILNDRYQTLAKVRYGVTSTVWLAKDLIASTYIVLKVYVTGQGRNHEQELRIYKQMNRGPQGRHVCLVHKPLGTSADVLVKMSPGHVMTLDDMKPGIRQLLIALDFLHAECHIIHTDLQLKNLLLPGPETSYLSRFEEAGVTDPSPRKVLKDRTIYKSLGFLPKGGLPVLADFGEARLGDKEHNEDIMPNVYRAPEVVLRSSWGYKVDIWSVAMIAWDIVSSRTLINGRNPDGIFDDRVHIAELIALLGPPPPQSRKQRHLSSAFWDKEGFLRWLRMALRWNPEDRPTALELLYDEWLMEGLGE
ncbi:kinase-like domain-containing protein [Aspergillus transmontanensis]|uniref:non-specific serine/threonine protein kinase n=1 Tax=Aspergillus transmontanensis TaxID=1034304 RepID=A0A5N6VPE0_9EURO|nr:kinase-like domain-containing protein [Aspergillus transmontanensis]